MSEYPLLQAIEEPSDLRRLPERDLPRLAHELRDFLLHSVARTGGHLSSNLGTVELTIALHYVFETPHDRLVWDVGHQTYAHKILTGRREQMSGLRKAGGISGFPKRSESPFDTFGTAHSSTSISAALGMALASQRQGIERSHVAIIGDGAMSAGMAFEAMNNAGVTPEANLLVVLNDNDMSISPPVGALNHHLARLMSGRFYAAARNVGKAVLQHVPPMLELARRVEEHAKGLLVPATLFEEFGLQYVGPVDGHDLPALIPVLQNMKAMKGPRFLHVVTRKGKGYAPAEADPILYHGPAPFDPAVGIVKNAAPASPAAKTYTQVFSDWICEQAAADPRLMAITPAMREGSGLVAFERQFPQRYFDVGIAEQHAVTFAAGLACENIKPVVAIYSTFLQRAYDQWIHDVALQDLDVTLAIDRAGLVGADGATHQGAYDIAYLRCIPGLVIATPSDENETHLLLNTVWAHPGPGAVRYPRGNGPGVAVTAGRDVVPIGQARVVVPPPERLPGRAAVGLLVFGPLLAEALKAAEALGAAVADMRFVKPLDQNLLNQWADQLDLLVTLEEGCLAGGAGSAVSEALQSKSIDVLSLGFPDLFIDHGDARRLLADMGLDAGGIVRAVQQHPRWGMQLQSESRPLE